MTASFSIMGLILKKTYRQTQQISIKLAKSISDFFLLYITEFLMCVITNKLIGQELKK